MRRVFSLIPLLLVVTVIAGCESKGTIRVDKVDPGQGTTGGGDRVTIVGGGFQPGKMQVDVRFGRHKADQVMIAAPNKIVVTTPPGERGPVDVTLIFDDGTPFVISEGFRYAPPAAGEELRKAFFDKKK